MIGAKEVALAAAWEAARAVVTGAAAWVVDMAVSWEAVERVATWARVEADPMVAVVMAAAAAVAVGAARVVVILEAPSAAAMAGRRVQAEAKAEVTWVVGGAVLVGGEAELRGRRW